MRAIKTAQYSATPTYASRTVLLTSPEGFPLEPANHHSGWGPAAMDRVSLLPSRLLAGYRSGLRSRSRIRETTRQSDQTCFRRFLSFLSLFSADLIRLPTLSNFLFLVSRLRKSACLLASTFPTDWRWTPFSCLPVIPYSFRKPFQPVPVCVFDVAFPEVKSLTLSMRWT